MILTTWYGSRVAGKMWKRVLLGWLRYVFSMRFRGVWFDKGEFWPRWFGWMQGSSDYCIVFWLWRFHFCFKPCDRFYNCER